MVRDHSRTGDTATDGRPSQFDLLLVAIPLALLAGVVSVVFFPIPQFVGITVGAAVAASLVAYGVYAIARSVPVAPEPQPDG